MTTQECPLPPLTVLIPLIPPLQVATFQGPESHLRLPQILQPFSHTDPLAVLRPGFIFLYPFYFSQSFISKITITIYHSYYLSFLFLTYSSIFFSNYPQ